MAQQILYIDFETSGLDPKLHAPLDFAAQLMVLDPSNRTLIKNDSFSTGLMRPWSGAKFSPEAVKVNGISEERAVAEGASYGEKAWEFASWLKGRVLMEDSKHIPVMVAGHNVQFDMRFLAAWFETSGNTEDLSMFHYRLLDVQSLAWGMLVATGLTTKSSLADCCRMLGVTNNAAHTAEGDVEAGSGVLHALLARL